MKRTRLKLLLATGLIALGFNFTPQLASGIEVLRDDFNGTNLNAAWTLTTSTNCASYAYGVSNSALNLTQITEGARGSLGNGNWWATVMCSRNFAPVGDFAVHYEFSWNEISGTGSMQGNYVDLILGEPTSAGYFDAWSLYPGEAYARSDFEVLGPYNPGFDSSNFLPNSGSASVDITRTNRTLTVWWHSASLDRMILQNTNATNAPLTGVTLHFELYPYQANAFGSEAANLITVSGTPVTYPRDAAEVKQRNPGATDGEYMIDPDGPGGNPPFSVYCYNMAGTPKEYLTLVRTGEGTNYAMHKAGGAKPGTDLYTHYSKIRLNPSKLVVDREDITFSVSRGTVNGWTTFDYADAGDCIAPYSQQGRANVDLRDTPFRVDPAVQFGLGTSYQGAGSANYSTDRKVVDVTGGGYCGRYWPQTDFILSFDPSLVTPAIAPTIAPPASRKA